MKPMRTATRILTKLIYGLFGAGFLAAGASTLLVNTGILPEAVRSALVESARNDPETLHVLQEFGSLLVFVGLITLWFLQHYDRSLPFHWVTTIFWALIALVHWFDVRGPNPSVVGPLVTTVPFALFALLGVMRLATESDRNFAAGLKETHA
jgi:hypothetical protein